jgi:hypothetical protein
MTVLRQAAGAVASVATDKRGVTRSQPQIHDGPRNALSVAKAKNRSSLGVRFSPPSSDQASSCHSSAARERQEERGPAFLPNRWLRAES